VSEHGSGRDDRWQHLAPIHSWMMPVTIVLVVVPLVAIGTLMYHGRNSATVPHFTAPPGASDATLPPPTTLPLSLAGLPLPAVDGTPTTPTVRIQGNASIGGTVTGPNGPIAGAVVHVQRIDGGYTYDSATGANGRYLLQGVPGGRYRLRAYRAPSYAQTESVVAFVGANETHTEDLHVDEYDQLVITAAVAPDPPVLGSAFTLVLRVAKRTVDGDGVVTSTPLPGAALTLTGALQLGSGSSATDTDGIATYLAGCQAVGPIGLQAQVKVTAADASQTVPVDLPLCAPTPTSTTTTPVTAAATTPTTAAPN
jgi:hypothetical protein